MDCPKTEPKSLWCTKAVVPSLQFYHTLAMMTATMITAALMIMMTMKITNIIMTRMMTMMWMILMIMMVMMTMIMIIVMMVMTMIDYYFDAVKITVENISIPVQPSGHSKKNVFKLPLRRIPAFCIRWSL